MKARLQVEGAKMASALELTNGQIRVLDKEVTSLKCEISNIRSEQVHPSEENVCLGFELFVIKTKCVTLKEQLSYC